MNPVFVVTTSYTADDLTDDWRWLIQTEVRLLLVSSMGMAFFEDMADGDVKLLNSISGEWGHFATVAEELQAKLKTPENKSSILMPDLVLALEAEGKHPKPNECYSFQKPPALGGTIEIENIDVCDLAVHFSIMGQIFRQLKDQPPGTRITSIRLNEMPKAADKPWWKFW